MLYCDTYAEALLSRPSGWLIEPLDDGFLVLSLDEYSLIYKRGCIFPAPDDKEV